MTEDDTELDSLAAQVRSFGSLNPDEITALLQTASAAGTSQERLVEHHLSLALDEALARRDRGVEVLDLYQEATVATIVAVSEYASRGGPAGGLRAYVGRVIGAHLDDTIEQAEVDRRADEAFVRDAQLFETAEVNLRHELARSPTTTELAALLAWPEERVAVVAEAVTAARAAWDAEIVQYLDDEN